MVCCVLIKLQMFESVVFTFCDSFENKISDTTDTCQSAIQVTNLTNDSINITTYSLLSPQN